jgi:hypothetical protein
MGTLISQSQGHPLVISLLDLVRWAHTAARHLLPRLEDNAYRQVRCRKHSISWVCAVETVRGVVPAPRRTADRARRPSARFGGRDPHGTLIPILHSFEGDMAQYCIA